MTPPFFWVVYEALLDLNAAFGSYSRMIPKLISASKLLGSKKVYSLTFPDWSLLLGSLMVYPVGLTVPN
jgi:hypothetical protein